MQCLQVKIVEQDQLSTGIKRSLHLSDVLNFYLDGNPMGFCHFLRRMQSSLYAASGRNVVFLDQDTVMQSHALIPAAADRHCVFLSQA